ncbi:MAG: pilin [Candidatus Nomurabacteria bacterium]|jgi:hypothetical protein|nr:pilin [Candidatus Nomurabacteria bacterium]
MTKQMQTKVFGRLRLVATGLLAGLVLLGMAAASSVLTARDAGAASNACDYCQGENCEMLGCGGKSGEAAVDETGQNVLDGIVWFGGIIAVIFIVVGGIQVVTSGGDPAKAKRGRHTMLFAVIGLIIALLSTVVVQAVGNLF